MERAIRLVAVAVCLTVLSVALAIGLLGRIAAAQSPGQAESGTVNRQATFTLLESTRISGTTVNTAAPLLLAGGADARDVSTWNSADVFLSATLAQSATLTATVQFSPDASLWADGGAALSEGPAGCRPPLIAYQPAASSVTTAAAVPASAQRRRPDGGRFARRAGGAGLSTPLAETSPDSTSLRRPSSSLRRSSADWKRLSGFFSKEWLMIRPR